MGQALYQVLSAHISVISNPVSKDCTNPYFRSELKSFTQGHTEGKQLSRDLWCQRQCSMVALSYFPLNASTRHLSIFQPQAKNRDLVDQRAREKRRGWLPRDSCLKTHNPGESLLQAREGKRKYHLWGAPQPPEVSLIQTEQVLSNQAPHCEASWGLGPFPWKFSPLWSQHSVHQQNDGKTGGFNHWNWVYKFGTPLI